MNHPKQRSRGGRSNNGGGGGGNRPPRQHGGNINVRTQVFDSNGPEGRIRGNAHQVMEKYLALARDASSQGDRVAAENYYQHAEHYFRLVNAYNQNNGQRRPQGGPTPAEDQAEPTGDDEDEGNESDTSSASDQQMEAAVADEQPAPAPAPAPTPAPSRPRRQPRAEPAADDQQSEPANA